jgi:hypothetical protein
LSNIDIPYQNAPFGAKTSKKPVSEPSPTSLEMIDFHIKSERYFDRTPY